MPDTSNPCSTASGSIATVVNGFAALACEPDLVVRRPQRPGGAVDDHQPAHPFWSVGGEEERAHRREPGREDRRLLGADGVHHRDGILGPAGGSDLVGPDARRHPHAAVIEPDQPAER